MRSPQNIASASWLRSPWAERGPALYARLALGAAFLSAVASRFGIWDGSLDWATHFRNFVTYTAQVNSFLPTATAPVLAWSATTAETILGVALIAGVQLRITALCASILLASFATAMALSFGLKSPLDYSVYSASAAALLLVKCERKKQCDL
jgi:uncharacterized membrane protein YphA (DoxX/SURF4 family)